MEEFLKHPAVLIYVASSIVAAVVGFAILKTDMSWIKKRMRAGDKHLAGHDRRLNNHQTKIARLETGCRIRHPGTEFPSVENGASSGGGD